MGFIEVHEKFQMTREFTGTGTIGERGATNPYPLTGVKNLRVVCENVGVGNSVDVMGRIFGQSSFTKVGSSVTGTTAGTVDVSLIDEIYFTCGTYSASGGTPKVIASGFFY